MKADPAPEPAGEVIEPPAEIECGWLLARDLDASHREVVEAARDRVRSVLSAAFPGFVWRFPVAVSPPSPRSASGEPAALLQQGAVERSQRGWDFALVVTSHDLRSYYKSHALAVPSRALAVAVLSLARIEPTDGGSQAAHARRAAALSLHLLGDLNGIWHADDADSWMHAPQSAADLDTPNTFDASQHDQLERALREVADLRLEEGESPGSATVFYLRAAHARAAEIASAVFQARPWELPLRLSRLTAASLSALFVFLITAEAWDLGVSQTARSVLGVAVAVLASTTVFILHRQKLLLRRASTRPTEQEVVTNVTAVLVVFLGLASAFAVLFTLALMIEHTLFSAEIVARWAPALARDRHAEALLTMAGLTSSFALVIGSLGASLEGNDYFRHVIYADEET